MRSIHFILSVIFLFACGNSKQGETKVDSTATPAEQATDADNKATMDTMSQTPAPNPYEKSNVQVKVYKNTEDNIDKNTWGYDIVIDNNPYIHQPTIPSLPGNNGFKSENEAKKAGNLMAYKIKHGIMPPAITPHELDSIGVKH